MQRHYSLAIATACVRPLSFSSLPGTDDQHFRAHLMSDAGPLIAASACRVAMYHSKVVRRSFWKQYLETIIPRGSLLIVFRVAPDAFGDDLVLLDRCCCVSALRFVTPSEALFCCSRICNFKRGTPIEHVSQDIMRFLECVVTQGGGHTVIRPLTWNL